MDQERHHLDDGEQDESGHGPEHGIGQVRHAGERRARKNACTEVVTDA
jgi:hypothetical protein